MLGFILWIYYVLGFFLVANFTNIWVAIGVAVMCSYQIILTKRENN